MFSSGTSSKYHQFAERFAYFFVYCGAYFDIVEYHGHWETDYYTANLNDALEIRDEKTIVDY